MASGGKKPKRILFNPELIRQFARAGATDNEIADFFGITRDTWIRRKKKIAWWVRIEDRADGNGAFSDIEQADSLSGRVGRVRKDGKIQLNAEAIMNRGEASGRLCVRLNTMKAIENGNAQIIIHMRNKMLGEEFGGAGGGAADGTGARERLTRKLDSIATRRTAAGSSEQPDGSGSGGIGIRLGVLETTKSNTA